MLFYCKENYVVAFHDQYIDPAAYGPDVEVVEWPNLSTLEFAWEEDPDPAVPRPPYLRPADAPIYVPSS
jgi:hypothetical protein